MNKVDGMRGRCKSPGLLLLALALIGCATQTDLKSAMEKKSACCSSMSEFTYAPLSATTPVEFTLDENAPVFGFATGKTYFKAVSLPKDAPGRKLRISSQPTGSVAFETEKYSQSFCPRVVFLDEQYREVGAAENIPQYARGFWSSAFVSEFEIPPSAQYAVLHTNPNRYGISAIRYTGGGAYSTGGTVVVNRGGEAIRHPCGPVANAAVELR